MILFIDRIVQFLLRTYRNRVFCRKTGCKATLVGKMTLINRNVKCGKNVIIYPDVQFFGDGPITIGDNVIIGNGTLIYASKEAGVSIGNDTLIAAQCYIIDTNHGTKAGEKIREQKDAHADIKIGNDCWLGGVSRCLWA